MWLFRLRVWLSSLAWIGIVLLAKRCNGTSVRSRATSSARGSSASTNDDASSDGGQDRFVLAAPLVVAAVCSDGVAIVATHTSFADEPLIMGDCDDEEELKTTTTSVVSDVNASLATTTNNTTLRMPKDLPRNYRGPFRISVIDGFGTCLACAGWRADAQLLAQGCRSLASQELSVFGKPSFDTCEYGHYIASEASLWMAQCAVSESRRSLSCVGLLALSAGVDACPGGYLWLIDASGAYPVRAHAVGGGILSKEGSLASIVNDQLSRIDFSSISKEHGARELVMILAKHAFGLPAAPRVEIATVGATPHRLVERKFVSSMFGSTK